jgi:hypothetical protein
MAAWTHVNFNQHITVVIEWESKTKEFKETHPLLIINGRKKLYKFFSDDLIFVWLKKKQIMQTILECAKTKV